MKSIKIFSVLPIMVFIMIAGCFLITFFTTESKNNENGFIRMDINFSTIKENVLSALKEQERDKIHEQSSLIKSEIINFLVNMDMVDRETLEPIE